MSNTNVLLALLFCTASSAAAAAQPSQLASPATLPIQFTNTVRADRAHEGDVVLARTSQPVRLADGTNVPAGARVTGHVVAASGFVYDNTHYAQQKAATLSIRFDSVQVAGAEVPLHVTVRAMADPVTTEAARTPKASDMDSLGTLTQVGGDQLVPSQDEVRDAHGDVVAYQQHGGVYAHLIASRGCDGTNVEVPVGIYSASACGLYGFTDVAATEVGSRTEPSTLTLVSTHTSPRIWKRSTALLETLPTAEENATAEGTR